jgi:hypothetical protein
LRHTPRHAGTFTPSPGFPFRREQESGMKLVPILIVALSIASLPAASALAQDQRNPPAKSGSNPQSSSSNVSGSTGFTNWSRDASQDGTTGAGSSGADEPSTATGLDLNGPAIKFPSGKAPE